LATNNAGERVAENVEVTDDLVAIGIALSWKLGGEISDTKLAECVWHLSWSEDPRAHELLLRIIDHFEEKNANTGE
jgi:hypothetical protein